MTEIQDAQATVDHYRTTLGQSSASAYMAYMRARQVLAAHRIETISAGQRGFMAAAAKPLTGAPA